ncbi:MAG: 2,3-bisphosphoglycerate-independent phosphoglycerate mutase [Candidatus Marinimicrobia bacterium]|nr:2,3-bisphosphoglycerate-independent phosphoglycerate mutase [Candidatus Neomarinimicrobiota bacterium]
MLRFILIILDGFGIRKDSEGNAVALAQTPELDHMLENHPVASIQTSGKYVGLPQGVMGNSEVGHMNLGAGRIVKQDLVRINDAIENDSLAQNSELLSLIQHVKEKNSTLHLLGLLSDGGVHSHIDHLEYIIDTASTHSVKKLVVHAITDGRDTAPDSGLGYINRLDRFLQNYAGYTISSVIGRYYAMDRDSRWDRIEQAYQMYISNTGTQFHTAAEAVQNSYKNQISDEFILPSVIGSGTPIQDNDGVLTLNFRADRMRQITTAINAENFPHFQTEPLNLHFTCMTRYQENFPYPVLFGPEKIDRIFPQILAENKFRQLRIAETEKYAHVTYFFNGGDENTFPGEERILIPSPKVATYDLQPEMSALEVTDNVLSAIHSNQFEAIIMNFANPDMVGHTGNLQAAVKAIEVIDSCVGKIRSVALAKGAAVFLTADHGNLEMMVDPETGKTHTAHTTLPVPLIMEGADKCHSLESDGKLADIAPTILDYLDIPIPREMTGTSLLRRVSA